MKIRRKFTREFKLSLINELESKSFVQVCREHDIHPSLLSKWKRDYQANPQEAFSGNGNIWKEDARVAQYERIIGQQCAEIAFLKKTLEVLQRKRAEERRRWLQ